MTIDKANLEESITVTEDLIRRNDGWIKGYLHPPDGIGAGKTCITQCMEMFREWVRHLKEDRKFENVKKLELEEMFTEEKKKDVFCPSTPNIDWKSVTYQYYRVPIDQMSSLVPKNMFSLPFLTFEGR